MNKFFTLILFLTVATVASAANFQILFGLDKANLQPVANGATYDTGYEIVELGGGAIKRYIQDAHLYLKAPVGTNMTFEVNAKEPVQVCCLGECILMSEGVKTGTVAAGSADLVDGTSDVYSLRIDKTTTNKVPNDVTVTIVAYETDNPAEKQTVTVNMLAKPQSEVGAVGTIEAAGNYVKLGSGNTLSYHFAAATRLEVYNIAGRLVLSRNVNGTGTLHLDLANGVYIYRAGSLTGKILLR